MSFSPPPEMKSCVRPWARIGGSEVRHLENIYTDLWHRRYAPVLAVSYHVATDKPPPKMATSSGLFSATIYNHSQLAERKHVARYWSINTAATAVPFGVHLSPLVITTKLAAAILGGRSFG